MKFLIQYKNIFRFLVAKLLYIYNCLSVCQVYGENAIFSAPIKDRGLNFSVNIPLLYVHLLYKQFFRRNVSQATKGRNVKIWKCDLLALFKIDECFFSVHIPLIYEHLFSRYFLRRSISHATKGRNVQNIETRFSSSLIKLGDCFFSVHIPLIYVHFGFSSKETMCIGLINKFNMLK